MALAIDVHSCEPRFSPVLSVLHVTLGFRHSDSTSALQDLPEILDLGLHKCPRYARTGTQFGTLPVTLATPESFHLPIRHGGFIHCLRASSAEPLMGQLPDDEIGSLFGLVEEYPRGELPSAEELDFAREWISSLYGHLLMNQYRWLPPHISVGIEKEVVLEWWVEDRKLTIYLLPDKVEYVRSWGVSIDDEMEDGHLATSHDIINTWRWLLG